MKALIVLLTLLPGAALAEAATAVPPPMTAEAEVSYAIASVAMLLNFVAMHWLVRRR